MTIVQAVSLIIHVQVSIFCFYLHFLTHYRFYSLLAKVHFSNSNSIQNQFFLSPPEFLLYPNFSGPSCFLPDCPKFDLSLLSSSSARFLFLPFRLRKRNSDIHPTEHDSSILVVEEGGGGQADSSKSDPLSQITEKRAGTSLST
jgi:hypothetical protein